MGNCKSDPTYNQLEVFFYEIKKFVAKRLGRMLTQRSIRIQNQLSSIKDENSHEKFMKLISISIKQNRYFYDQLEEIFEKFGFILPEKFMSVQNSYSQELKKLLGKFKEQYPLNVAKISQKSEQIKVLQQKVVLLENMRVTITQPKIECISKDQQQINRLNRIILKHEKNTQNDKRLINQMRSQILNMKLLQEQKQHIQKENKQMKIDIMQSKSQIQVLKRQNIMLKDQKKLNQNKQSQLNPQIDNNKSLNLQQVQKDLQQKQLEMAQKLNQINLFQQNLRLKDSQISSSQQKLMNLKQQLSLKSQYLQNLEKQLIKRQMTLNFNDQTKQQYEKQIIERNIHVTLLESKIQRLQHQLSQAKKIQNELKQTLIRKEQHALSVLEKSKEQQISRMTLNGEDPQITKRDIETIQVQETSNDFTQNYKISDENKAVVHEILTKKLSFAPWKGFLNKFVLDLGLTMNGGLTYGLYQKNQNMIKKPSVTYTDLY